MTQRRPHDTGRKDSLGRTIRTGNHTTTTRPDAPPPNNTTRPPAFTYQQPRHPNPNAGVNTVGQFVSREDLLAEARRNNLQVGESAGYTIDATGASTGGMTILTPDYGPTLAAQIAHEDISDQTMRIITRTEHGYTFTDWPNEPHDLNVTQLDPAYEGGWRANTEHTPDLTTYGTRDAAIAGYHRSTYHIQRQRRIGAITNHAINRIQQLPDDTKQIIGETSVGYLGNVDPNGTRNDSRRWSISARDWTDPNSIYNNNPIKLDLGDTTDIVRMSPDDMDAKITEFIATSLERIESGRYRRRLR